MHPQWICVTWFAKLIECQNAVQDAGTGPSLRILKKQRRMCCLCNYICKWLDVQVFSDKDYKPCLLVSCIFRFAWLAALGHFRTSIHVPIAKCRAKSFRCHNVALSHRFVLHIGLSHCNFSPLTELSYKKIVIFMSMYAYV